MPTVNLADDLAPWEERIARGDRVVATFKHEDEERGVPYGPFILTAPDEDDPKVRRIEGRDGAATIFAYPFGYRPTNTYSTADRDDGPLWVSLPDAQKFAAALGVELGEA